MSSKGRPVTVGIFIVAAFAVMMVTVFLIGDNRRQWDRKLTFHAKFNNVQGLRSGAAVRIGGIDVGSVSDVAHNRKDPNDSQIYVTIEVATSEAGRVHPDTEARIVGRGLLGDKMMVLVGGTGAPAPDDSFIASKADPGGLAQAMADAQNAAKQASIALENVQRATEQIADPEFSKDIHGSVKALHEILDGVAHKDSVAHRLIFDQREAQRIDRILANLDGATANLKAVTADVNVLTTRAKTGPGLVHSLVYDDKLAESTAGTLAELHGGLRAIRTGNGLAHAVVYGDDAGSSQHVMSNLAVMSDDLRAIIANVRAGRGTIGALLVDPSVYEDIKTLVGNVERNDVLRALVRYSIKQNERPHAVVSDEKASGAKP